ncbi:LysM peptidoglycan-binding domain-containing protein [Pseudooceanicola sp. CBS1P-1]|uniref:LysM peptidoglycan-binding domain-containing protein n=1 Tax=Pseudooceanicola albus TaxID=2692189 RepID=A0A6L7G027_9RHOB|nr:MULTISPECIES: LysM peptidoglycan-binding domain-containing protein [Pseudooceanicola]MBT9382501.1 LysM peptidoglycan-binding domain-containing protein [Pseudooceanicola endophyticus]MXN17042.1 LysM peptidoglycan-binding domain-containing protein [Pseudooceanicola albus]
MTETTSPRPAAPALPAVRITRLLLGASLLGLMAACTNFDSDLRGGFGQFSTADAARAVTATRPQPDNRGIISYPNYQVAVARRGDTVASVAQRIGMNAQTLAGYNGLQPGDQLRDGEILSLPSRVAEPSMATGAAGVGPIISPDDSSLTTMAGDAINRAADNEVSVTTLPPATPDKEPVQVGHEPIRHKVQRGETAYSIARLYGVSVRSLADWNSLDSNFTIREGQYLLIPLVNQQGGSAAPVATAAASTTLPGQPSPTPLPPSASKPLPADNPEAITAPPSKTEQQAAKAATPDLSKEQAPSGALMGYPVRGSIVRTYQKGKSDGIDLSAEPGAPVKAAAAGTVAAILQDTDNQSVIVLKHEGTLLTLYSNVSNIVVAKGDTVERGQQLAQVPTGANAFLHFEVRKGLETVDPMQYLSQ